MEWDPEATGLTAVRNVKPTDSSQSVDLLVVAFTSPGYQPGSGSYYAGSLWGAIGETQPESGDGSSGWSRKRVEDA